MPNSICTLYRDEYVEPIPEEERGDIILAYHAQLNSIDDEIRMRAARAWTKWEYAPLFLCCTMPNLPVHAQNGDLEALC